MEYLWILGVVICMLALSAKANAEILIDTDFGAATEEVEVVNKEKDLQVRGMLPAGWSDNSSWASVHAEYQPMEEEGTAFLRVQVEKVTSGRLQISYRPLPDIHEDNYYRLSLKARSISSSSINIVVRMQGSPYKSFWEKRLALSETWQDYSFDFQMQPNEQPIGFWITFDGVGAVDIASLRMIEQTREELLRELKAEYKGVRLKNLLRVSRFPLGIQSGWSLDRDSSDVDDVLIAADPDTVGPSAAPALKMQSDEPMRLYTAPFAVPMIFESHTASVYIRGQGNGRLIVLCDGRPIAGEEFALKPEDDWQRIQVAFAPRLLARAYGVRIEGQGSFWIDAMQVEPGTEANPYSGQLACEVALACPPGDAANARVQFEDESPSILYCVSGEASNGKLKAKVVNLYNEEKMLREIPIGEGFLHFGELQYDVFPDKPYGAFRVEAWVENSSGERISPYNEVVVYRLRRPRYWMKDAPDSPFGVHTNSTTRHILMAKAVGSNWVRLHDAGLDYLGWYHLEPEQGQWKFRDKELHRYRRLGMKILGELGTAPKWASYYQDVGRDHSGYFDRYYQPKRLEDYANYVRIVTQRYKGVIDAYDVWNEPWIHAWWAVGYDESKSDRDGYITSENPTGDFANLTTAAYQNAKSTDDAITILGVNSTAGARGEEWTRGIVEHSGLDHCDVVCYHQYTGGPVGYPGDSVTNGFQTATGPIVERFGKNPKPVWMTEGSSVSGMTEAGFYNHTLPYQASENVVHTADRLCRYVVSLLAQGVEKVFLYTMHGHSYFPNGGQWRVLVTDEGALHPSGAAHSAMAWYLEDTRFVRTLTVADGVYAYLFKGSDGSVAVLSTKPGHAEFRIPQQDDVHAVDLFGNPIARDALLGDTLVYLSTSKDIQMLEKLLRNGS